jgi:hypothetical protein
MPVQTREKHLGWFGCQSRSEPPEGYERSVQFHCGSDDAVKKAQAFIRERVCNGPPGKTEIDRGMVLFKYGGDDIGDAEWFDSVFKALADR